ncbi:hypothetical protein GQ457_13G020490 [Hibiscus cannabinus]
MEIPEHMDPIDNVFDFLMNSQLVAVVCLYTGILGMDLREKIGRIMSVIFALVLFIGIIHLLLIVIVNGLRSLVYIFNYIFPFNKLNSGTDGEIKLSIWLSAPASIVCWILVPLSGWLLYNLGEKIVSLSWQPDSRPLEPRISLYTLPFTTSFVSAIFFSLQTFEKVGEKTLHSKSSNVDNFKPVLQMLTTLNQNLQMLNFFTRIPSPGSLLSAV